MARIVSFALVGIAVFFVSVFSLTTWTMHGIGGLATAAFAAAQASVLRAHPKIEPAIVKALDGYLDAVLARDAARVAALYVEDAAELPDFEPVVKGRSAIERRYRAMFASPVRITEFTFTHDEAVIQGDLAYDVGTYRQRRAMPDGTVVTDIGKHVVILKRNQGEWRAAYVIYNGDAAPPAPKGPAPLERQ